MSFYSRLRADEIDRKIQEEGLPVREDGFDALLEPLAEDMTGQIKAIADGRNKSLGSSHPEESREDRLKKFREALPKISGSKKKKQRLSQTTKGFFDAVDKEVGFFNDLANKPKPKKELADGELDFEDIDAPTVSEKEVADPVVEETEKPGEEKEAEESVGLEKTPEKPDVADEEEVADKSEASEKVDEDDPEAVLAEAMKDMNGEAEDLDDLGDITESDSEFVPDDLDDDSDDLPDLEDDTESGDELPDPAPEEEENQEVEPEIIGLELFDISDNSTGESLKNILEEEQDGT